MVLVCGDGVGVGTPSDLGPSASNLPSNVGSFVPPNIQSLAARVVTQTVTGTQQAPAQASASSARPPLPPSSMDSSPVEAGSGELYSAK